MSGLKVCLICSKTFHIQSGKFAGHLKEKHSVSLRDYALKYEYGNNPPKCQCGYCDEITPFFRGKFKENFIYSAHRNPLWKKGQHIKKHGKPICQSCGGEHDNFNRGLPRKHCSECIKNGKINQNNPEPFRKGRENAIKSMMKKYGVDNPMKLKSSRQKASTRMKENNPMKNTEFAKKSGLTQKKRIMAGLLMPYSGIKRKVAIDKARNTKIEKYDNGNYDPEKVKQGFLKNHGVEHISQTDEFRNAASKRMIKYNSNWIKNHTIKKFKTTKLYYQSLYELDFLELCESNNILNRISNGNSYKYLNPEYGHHLLTDFCLDNKYEIEIKSSYILKKQGGMSKLFAKKESVEVKGKKYVFILDKDYSELKRIFHM